MDLSGYRNVLRVPGARGALILGALIRIPVMAIGVVLTLHVVQALHRSYGEAGLIVTAQTVCLALSAPWRGRRLDRLGLRKALGPCVVVSTACWTAAPWLGYWPLLVVAGLAGIYALPVFGVIRQALIAVIPDEDRRSALSLDSVILEISFMIGPVLGVLAATTWDTRWSLCAFGIAEGFAGALLLIANPMLRSDAAAATIAAERTGRPRGIVTVHFLSICALAATATLVIEGTSIAIVAAMRQFDAQSAIGIVMALWGLGSMLGGLAYGAWPRSVRSSLLLGGLALVTLPAALAHDPLTLGLLCVLAGLLCGPTITATVDELSRTVPERARGEAMGWHGSAMTAGSALGSPIAGVSIDQSGFGGGFLAVGLTGAAVAAASLALIARFRIEPAIGQNQPAEPEPAG